MSVVLFLNMVCMFLHRAVDTHMTAHYRNKKEEENKGREMEGGGKDKWKNEEKGK